MSLKTVIKKMNDDISDARVKIHRLHQTSIALNREIKMHYDLLYTITMIVQREGVPVECDADIPRALEAVIAKLKEPSPTHTEREENDG